MRRIVLITCLLLVLAAATVAMPVGASTADATVPLNWWSPKGTYWTLAQARAALLTVPVVEAGIANVDLAQWLFVPSTITTLRGNGPSKRVSSNATWTRFEVRMRVHPQSGYWIPASGGPAVAFCLHANGTVKTNYPWTDWVATGFRAADVPPQLTTILCTPTLANRQAFAIPFRR